MGVIVQFGGQTPLKLSRALEAAGAPIIGHHPTRSMWQRIASAFSSSCGAWAQAACQYHRAQRRAGGAAGARGRLSARLLCGRAMEIVFNEDDLRAYMGHAMRVSNDSPVLLDRFLDVAIEVDVDAVCDGEDVLISAASWSTSSRRACTRAIRAARCRPAASRSELQDELRAQTRKLARALNSSSVS